MGRKIGHEAILALTGISIIDGNVVKLADIQYDNKVYSEIKEIFLRLHGEWNRSLQGFIFPYPPAATIISVVESGEMPEKNPNAFFPTPEAIVMRMFKNLDSRFSYYEDGAEGLKILEPSAGQGALAKALRAKYPTADIDTVEYFELNQNILRKEGFEPFCGSFLDFNTDFEKKYDIIFMNPPFSVSGDSNAYITHIEHAYKMLSSDGELEVINGGAFKESGTMVETCIIKKEANPWRLKPMQGHKNHYVYSMGLVAYSSYPMSSIVRGPDYEEQIDELINLIISDAMQHEELYPLEFMEDYRQEIRNLLGISLDKNLIHDEEPLLPIDNYLSDDFSFDVGGGLFSLFSNKPELSDEIDVSLQRRIG